MRDAENIYNLFIFLKSNMVCELGAVCHRYVGEDSEKKIYLQRVMESDLGNARRFQVPHDQIRIWLNLSFDQTFTFEMLNYLIRSGHVLRLFESVFQNLDAPRDPLTCITLVQDGVPIIDAISQIDPVSGEEGQLLMSEFGGQILKCDYFGKYITEGQLDLNRLLEDDFLKAIKLLYDATHYVSAMKLILSFIDTLAYLEFGDKRGIFKGWLSAFADLAPVGITPSQVWELRCGLLHMTNHFSRAVLDGREASLCFYSDINKREVIWNKDKTAIMFSLEAFYDAIIQAIGNWCSRYSGNLERQLEFIRRYDQVLPEGRVSKFRDVGKEEKC